MFTKKTETIKFNDFMSGSYKERGKGVKRRTRQNEANLKHFAQGAVGIPVIGHILTKGSLVMASDGSAYGTIPMEAIPVGAVSGAVTDKIVHAFDPLIDLMVALSLPIAGVMLTGGALMIMIGQKDMGFRLIMNSALGYCLVQMSPLFIDLLAGVGSAI